MALERLAEQVNELRFEKRRTNGAVRSPRDVASPRDTLVQRAAARYLRILRQEKGFTFREIGEVFGVSHERARQVYHRLVGEAEASAERPRQAAG